ncbi:MAG: sigma-54 dependent transcriptional regulator [Candidatus Poribacteria bacterium]|nr:sigma-54 dependent transcriptional regulator [Candidatus Poribacteria bacterium]
MEEKVLIIDDNQSFGELKSFLTDNDYSPIIVNTVRKGLGKIKKCEDRIVVLLNVESSAEAGLKALARIKKDHPTVIVIIIGAGVQTARKAMPLGALDVLSTDTDIEHIRKVLDGALKRLSIRPPISDDDSDENEKSPKDPHPLVGEHKDMFELNKLIGRVARYEVSVLIEGETGTGKGLVARLIHEESERADEPFIAIDCGGIPSELLENELFGHEPGAFADARERKPGLFEVADGGTLFLDEIGNMALRLQSKLLNVLQTRKIRRVGGIEEHTVDVRIITATNRKLEKMVEREEFRMDLFHRLCGYKISLPPLRERKEDIPLLVAYFLQRIEEENDKPIYGVSEEVLKLFQEYNWPGNVRELDNCLKSATTNSRGEVILLDDLPPEIQKYRDDGGSEEDVGNTPSETLVAPVYENLFNLPVVVFCQFISDARSDVTDNQIARWWVEFSNYGRDRADKAKRKIDDWRVEWNTTWFTLPDLSERIKAVVDDALSQLSNRHRMGSEAEPISIKGRTLRGSVTAVLQEIVKAHGGDREKAAKELDMTVKELEKRLSYIVNEKEYEGDKEKAAGVLDIPVQQLEEWLSYWTEKDRDDRKNALQTTIEPSRELERFRGEDIRRLLTKSVISFVLEFFPRIEWRDKSPGAKIRVVHLALKILSKRLTGDRARLTEAHGCIYFGGMTLSQIERNIYRRAPYLYKSPKEAIEALDVDPRKFKEYWPENKPFPSHYTLFTG